MKKAILTLVFGLFLTVGLKAQVEPVSPQDQIKYPIEAGTV